jgi:hypothetical protein
LASKIYKTAAESTTDTETINRYLAEQKYVKFVLSIIAYFIEYNRKFDVHAAQIIDKCFAQNEKFALQVLTTKSKLYFDYSPLELAKETDSRAFLATKCVQKYLDRLWYGDIDRRGVRKFHIDLLVCKINIDHT